MHNVNHVKLTIKIALMSVKYVLGNFGDLLEYSMDAILSLLIEVFNAQVGFNKLRILQKYDQTSKN